MKTCPFCAEELQDAAATCTRCRRELTASGPSQPTASSPPFTQSIALVVALVLAAVILVLFLLAAPAAN
jgi:predicted amidophosphoribosyltransferase